MTEWRDVVGWEGLYAVSFDGRVKGLSRSVGRSNGTVQTWGEVELKPIRQSKGYYLVRLSRPGERRMARIHRIVADAFLEPAHTNETVNHKDGDKANNRAANLEWATRAENVAHAIANGLGDYIPPRRKKMPIPPAPQTDE